MDSGEERRHQILEELAKVEARLNDGITKIEEAQARYEDTQRWETLWLSLLDEYEQLYKALAKENA